MENSLSLLDRLPITDNEEILKIKSSFIRFERV
jgi:hypothetical protein